MTRLSPPLLLLTLSSGLASSALAGQGTVPTDSAAVIPSRTWVRIQTRDGGATWQVGELGRTLPDQCVFIMVAPPGSGAGDVVAIFAGKIVRLDVSRGRISSDRAEPPDAADDQQWTPYPMATLRQQQSAAGCPNGGAKP
jgi:hypothetical protein